MQKTSRYFQKNCRKFPDVLYKKILAILLSFLKEFTESKKREKNVFPIIKERQKK